MKRKNNLVLAFVITLAVFFSVRVFAQAEVMEDYSVIKLQALDKSTARTVTFQAKVGSTIQYGSLFIKTQACRKSPPLEKPESAAFMQIWEVPVGKEKSEWIFSGWMFASSPALSAMDHPVYDVWVLDCLGSDEENSEAKSSQIKKQTADPTVLEAVEGEKDTDIEDSEALETEQTEENTSIDDVNPVQEDLQEQDELPENNDDDSAIEMLLDKVIE